MRLFCAQITEWPGHSEHGHPALWWTAQRHDPIHMDVEYRGSWIPGASDPVSGGFRDKSSNGMSCHLVLSSPETGLEQRDAHRLLSVSQACKHTLTICALELKWSTFQPFTEHYNFELVVLNICNNLVSGPCCFLPHIIERTWKDLQNDVKVLGTRVNLGEGKRRKWVITYRAYGQRKLTFSPSSSSILILSSPCPSNPATWIFAWV